MESPIKNDSQVLLLIHADFRVAIVIQLNRSQGWASSSRQLQGYLFQIL